MKKFFKRFGIALGLLLLPIAIYLGINYKHTAAFPRIISAFYAKEFCSCYFVTEGDEKQCHNFARQWVPIQSFALDKEKRSVTVKGLYVTTTVRYSGDKYGCVFE